MSEIIEPYCGTIFKCNTHKFGVQYGIESNFESQWIAKVKKGSLFTILFKADQDFAIRRVFVRKKILGDEDIFVV